MGTSSRSIIAASIALATIMLASCGSDSTAEDASAPVVSTAAPRLEAVDGVEFSDPEGDYTITIGSEWVPSPVGAVEDGVESWVVAPPGTDFSANVNVLTQSTEGLDLVEYLELSVENTGTFEVIEQTTLTGENGNELGRFEFAGPVEGTDLDLHFLAIVDVTDGMAVLATLSTLEADFDALRANVEPFMLTLQAE